METVQNEQRNEREKETECVQCEFWQRIVAMPVLFVAALLAFLAYMRVLQ